MPRTKGKKKDGATPRPEAAGATNQSRAGLPAPDSVVEVKEIRRGGKVYRIIKTDERDEYDKPEAPARRRKRKQ
jgi:hypothetical protein